MIANPIVGHTYYDVSFADNSLTMPIVEPLVYLGENLYSEDSEPGKTLFYFEGASSHLHQQSKAKREIYCFKEDDLYGLHTLKGAIRKMQRVLAGEDLTKAQPDTEPDSE